MQINNVKLLKKSLLRLISTAIVFFLANQAEASQQQLPRVKFSVAQSSVLKVEVWNFGAAGEWSFRNAYAGALGLGERIKEFRGFETSGVGVSMKKLASGEFRSEHPATRITYLVRIPPGNSKDLPHVSWLVEDYGFLMLGDLLPMGIGRINVEFDLPADWSSYSSSKHGEMNTDRDPETAVYFVGRSLRSQQTKVRGMDLRLVIRGLWNFSDKRVIESASKVLEKYIQLTKFPLRTGSIIFIAPFPLGSVGSNWKAETRGSSVCLLMDPQANINNWVGQLGIIFTHELLHLWVPNSLKLRGSYDWFFEGFTLYVALQTALSLKLIRFQDYLETLGRVYSSYKSYQDTQSLVQASESRWMGSSPVVYDKGMLVAFLYDLTMRLETDGKVGLTDQYRELFARFADEPAEGNDAIINLLSSSAATGALIRSYTESGSQLHVEGVLSQVGLELAGGQTFKVRTGISDKQRTLLRSLGYRK